MGKEVGIRGYSKYTIDDAGNIYSYRSGSRRKIAQRIHRGYYHVNIKDDNFQFINNDKVVFGIDGEDINNCSVTINPDTFILGNTEGNAIVLENNKLSINADFIDSGKISADILSAGTIDANVITVKNLSGDNIDAKGLTVYREEDNNKIKTFEIKF